MRASLFLTPPAAAVLDVVAAQGFVYCGCPTYFFNFGQGHTLFLRNRLVAGFALGIHIPDQGLDIRWHVLGNKAKVSVRLLTNQAVRFGLVQGTGHGDRNAQQTNQ